MEHKYQSYKNMTRCDIEYKMNEFCRFESKMKSTRTRKRIGIGIGVKTKKRNKFENFSFKYFEHIRNRNRSKFRNNLNHYFNLYNDNKQIPNSVIGQTILSCCATEALRRSQIPTIAIEAKSLKNIKNLIINNNNKLSHNGQKTVILERPAVISNCINTITMPNPNSLPNSTAISSSLSSSLLPAQQSTQFKSASSIRARAARFDDNITVGQRQTSPMAVRKFLKRDVEKPKKLNKYEKADRRVQKFLKHLINYEFRHTKLVYESAAQSVDGAATVAFISQSPSQRAEEGSGNIAKNVQILSENNVSNSMNSNSNLKSNSILNINKDDNDKSNDDENVINKEIRLQSKHKQLRKLLTQLNRATKHNDLHILCALPQMWLFMVLLLLPLAPVRNVSCQQMEQQQQQQQQQQSLSVRPIIKAATFFVPKPYDKDQQHGITVNAAADETVGSGSKHKSILRSLVQDAGNSDLSINVRSASSSLARANEMPSSLIVFSNSNDSSTAPSSSVIGSGGSHYFGDRNSKNLVINFKNKQQHHKINENEREASDSIRNKYAKNKNHLRKHNKFSRNSMNIQKIEYRQNQKQQSQQKYLYSKPYEDSDEEAINSFPPYTIENQGNHNIAVRNAEWGQEHRDHIDDAKNSDVAQHRLPRNKPAYAFIIDDDRSTYVADTDTDTDADTDVDVDVEFDATATATAIADDEDLDSLDDIDDMQPNRFINSDDNQKLMRLVMSGLGIQKLPDMGKVNISQHEYVSKYREYLRRVHERKRRELAELMDPNVGMLEPYDEKIPLNMNQRPNEWRLDGAALHIVTIITNVTENLRRQRRDVTIDIADDVESLRGNLRTHSKNTRSSSQRRGSHEKTRIHLHFPLHQHAENLHANDVEEANIRLMLIQSSALAIKYNGHQSGKHSCGGGKADRKQQKPQKQRHTLQLKIYQLLENGKRTWIDGRKIELEVDRSKPDDTHSQWLEFDVTKAVKVWLDRQEANLGLEVQCDNCQKIGARILNDVSASANHHSYNYNEDGGNDDDEGIKSFDSNSHLIPVLNIIGHLGGVSRRIQSQHSQHSTTETVMGNGRGDITSTSNHHRNATVHRTNNNHGHKTNCYKSNQRCCRHSMEVTFKEIKGFEFIIQPKVFDAGYCHGRCPPRFNPAHHHAMLQSLIWKQNRKRAPRPCCAPSKLMELEVLHVDEKNSDKLKISTWTDMRVIKCACS